MEAPLLYVLLGTPGSGRRAIFEDLAQSLWEDEMGEILLLVQEEEEARADLPEWHHLTSLPFRLGDRTILPADAESFYSATGGPIGLRAVFILFDGLGDLADQMEALATWLPESPFEMGRVITLVDCSLAREREDILPWYDASVHFSDIVLLNHREAIPNRWVADFQDRYRKSRLPVLFDLVKKGRVRNPAEVLFPEARRVSQIFEREDDPFASLEVIIEEEAEDVSEEDEEEALLPIEEDPYLRRHPDGRRQQPLPDLRKLLLPTR